MPIVILSLVYSHAHYNQTLFLEELFYLVGTGIIKVSFALTLLRIVTSRVHIFVLHAMIAMVTIITVFHFFWTLLLCKPMSYTWDRAVYPERGSCENFTSLIIVVYTHSAVMLAADFTLGFIMPLLVLHPLQMRRNLKIIAYISLGIGSV